MSEASYLRFAKLLEARSKITPEAAVISRMLKSDYKAFLDYLKYVTKNSNKLSVFRPNLAWTKITRFGKVAGPDIAILAEGGEYYSIIAEKKTVEQVEDDYDSWFNPL